MRAHLADKDFADARVQLRKYLWSQVEGGGNGSISDAIEALAKSGRPLPAVAAVLVRSLGVDGFLPTGSDTSRVDREIVSIVELGLPRLTEFIGVEKKSQTFEKFPKIRAAHHRVWEILAPLKSNFQTLEAIIAARQPIISALNHNCVRTYGEYFCLGSLRVFIESVFHSSQEVLRSRATFALDVENCRQIIRDGLDAESECGSFIFYDFVVPFLRHADVSLQSFIRSARGRFSARIICLIPDGERLPKRYPLREAGREMQIRIPLRNAGPGIAREVRAEITVGCEQIVLQTPKIAIGDVSGGDFYLEFDAMVIEPANECKIEALVEWGEVGSDERKSDIFEVTVGAQSADIDWTSFEYWHPYSTATAEGDRFIGRTEIVKELAARLMRDPMEPFYITGQKRVGKTSLALASTAFAQSQARQKELHSTYILWGQIAYADANASVAALGLAIEDLIAAQLPSNISHPKCVFEGSLAPLMRLAAVARDTAPHKQFIIIVDELI